MAIRNAFFITCALFAAVPTSLCVAQMAEPAATDKPAKPVKKLKILAEADMLPQVLLSAPPAPGSTLEKAELAELRRIIAEASPARMEQARQDDVNEDPSIFDAAIGGGFEAKKLPLTYELLSLAQNEGSVTANMAKKHFARLRPWAVDPTLPNCDAGKNKKPATSYPSGHSTLGYTVGAMLAYLMPEKAEVINARAQDYALSREICGVHYRADTEASHVIGTAVSSRLLTMPAMQKQIAAARAELRAKGFITK